MLTIGVVASEIGVSPATLRKWEARYGFPVPTRSPSGTRLYSSDVIARLREAKRLLERGFRPSAIFAMGDLTAELSAAEPWARAERLVITTAAPPVCAEAHSAALIALLKRHELDACRRRLEQALFSLGVCRFVEEVAAPLMSKVGHAWAQGELEVFTEHGITTLMHSILNEATQRTGRDTVYPTIVLSTPADERHTLGLAMATASLTDAGAHCVNLGASLPVAEIVGAAQAYHADVVGLSISCAAPPRLSARFLADLRGKLPAEIELWVGGEGSKTLANLPPGTRQFSTASAARPMIQAMQARRHANTSAPYATQGDQSE